MPTIPLSDSQSVIPTNDIAWPVYTPQPINQDHGLNAGRVLWLLGIPPLDGGAIWWDLCGAFPGTLTSMTALASNGWRRPTRSNGFSPVQFDGTAALVNTNFLGISGATHLSVAMWFKRPTTSTIAALVGSHSAGSNQWDIIAFSDGNVYCIPGVGSTSCHFPSNDTQWHRVLATYDGTQSTNAGKLQMYLDGVSQTITFTGAIVSSIPSIAQALQVGRDPVNNRWANGLQDDISVWTRTLTAAEAWADYELSLLGYPGVLNRFRPTPTIFTSAGVIGTGAITLGALSVSGVGSFASNATGAITLGPLVVTATGSFASKASGAITLAPLVVTAAGSFSTTGSGAITLSPFSVSGVGATGQFGAGAITLGALTPSGTGTFTTTGTGAITLGALSPVGVGSFKVTGSGSIALAGLGVSGVGITGQFGAGAITLAPLIVAGVGTFSGGSTITTYADPRQGTVLNPDSDPFAVDPRQGFIISTDADPAGVNPRKGTVIG